MKSCDAKIRKIKEDMRKANEAAADKELERRLRPDSVTQAIISHLQNHGSATVEEIVASSPVAHLIEERVETLYNQGRLKKRGGHYVMAPEKQRYK